jgi:glycosyltransferase involved in cell wall biosynthesis
VRITFLTPHLRIAGGVRAILTYADRLAGRGHEVTVLVPARSGARAWWRNRTQPGGPDWMPGLRARVRWVPAWDAAALPAGDVLVATAWQSAAAVAAAPAACGRRFYLVQHYESLYHGERVRVDATYRLPLRKIAISTWLADILRERFGQGAEVLVTPVDPALFRPMPADDDGCVRVLMLHHDYAWKGVAEGLEAVAKVRPGRPGLRLVGFGVKPPRDGGGYDEFVANPPQERLAALYSRCPIYLCPSWDEGLGMPSMEAMTCGAALVTFDNGGCRDYALHERTALVAPRRDVGALADALARVADDAGLRARLARAGQEWVSTRFEWERATARMEQLFQEGT